jgi:hypothetical protein
VLGIESTPESWAATVPTVGLGQAERQPAEPHFELRLGSTERAAGSPWVLIARVGRPIKRVFGVELIFERTLPTSAIIDELVAEVDFLLVTVGGPDPWAYAQYHCTTASNLYSSIHWSFHRGQASEGIARKGKPGEVVHPDKGVARTAKRKAVGANATTRARQVTSRSPKE